MLPATVLTAAIAKSEYDFRRESSANPVDPSRHHFGYYAARAATAPGAATTKKLRTMVCLHGYPNNSAIYDNTVKELMSRRDPSTGLPPFAEIVNCQMPFCSRAEGRELPTFSSDIATIESTNPKLPPNRSWGFTLDECAVLFLSTIAKAVEGERDVAILAHDWGCITTYLALLRLAKVGNNTRSGGGEPRVLPPNIKLERLILLDVGWLGPRATLRNLLYTVSYQLPLNLWFMLPSSLGGNALTRAQAALQGNAQKDASLVLSSAQNYFYRSALRDVATKGPLTELDSALEPALMALKCPVLFIFGDDRPTHARFCDETWFATIENTKRGESRCVGMRGGHWMMLDNFTQYFDEVWEFVVATRGGSSTTTSASERRREGIKGSAL